MELSTKNKQSLIRRYTPCFEYVFEKYDGVIIELNYKTPFQLLIAVILSAQTTDKQVNKITPPLFEIIKEPKDVLNISLEQIESYTKYVNFFRNKSKFIKETGTILALDYDGIIPNDLKLLQTFPGIGVKTAKVVLSVLYNAPLVWVDTHIHRVTNRWGLVHTKTPNETDKVLEILLPTSLKVKIHHPLVLFWRYHCTARNPNCQNCSIANKCNYYKSLYSREVNQ